MEEPEKKKIPTAVKMGIGALAFTIVPALVAGGWTLKQANDMENAFAGDAEQPSAAAPAMPGGEGAETTSEFQPALKPVELTNSEIATLEAGDSKASQRILDEKLIPRIQEAVDLIRTNIKNRGKSDGFLSGLDLRALAPSNEAVDVIGTMALASEEIQICHTTSNVNGDLNFCAPDDHSIIELGKPIDFRYVTMVDEQGHQLLTEIHAEIVNGDQLILTGDG